MPYAKNCAEEMRAVQEMAGEEREGGKIELNSANLHSLRIGRSERVLRAKREGERRPVFDDTSCEASILAPGLFFIFLSRCHRHHHHYYHFYYLKIRDCTLPLPTALLSP